MLRWSQHVHLLFWKRPGWYFSCRRTLFLQSGRGGVEKGGGGGRGEGEEIEGGGRGERGKRGKKGGGGRRGRMKGKKEGGGRMKEEREGRGREGGGEVRAVHVHVTVYITWD